MINCYFLFVFYNNRQFGACLDASINYSCLCSTPMESSDWAVHGNCSLRDCDLHLQQNQLIDASPGRAAEGLRGNALALVSVYQPPELNWHSRCWLPRASALLSECSDLWCALTITTSILERWRKKAGGGSAQQDKPQTSLGLKLPVCVYGDSCFCCCWVGRWCLLMSREACVTAGNFVQERTHRYIVAIQHVTLHSLLSQTIHCYFAPDCWQFNVWQDR